MPIRLCSVKGCGRAHVAKGLCRKHYQQMTRGRPPMRKPRRPRVCSVEGCNKPHKSRGYCAMHVARLKRLGEPGPAESKWRTAKPGATTKVCARCHVEKPFDEFYCDKKLSDGRKSYCKKCYHELYLAYREPAKLKKRDAELKSMFGINLQEYNRIIQQQGGKIVLRKQS